MHIYLRDLMESLQRQINMQTFNINPSHIITAIQMLPAGYSPDKEQLDNSTLYVCEYRKFMQLDYMKELPPIICVVEPGMNADSMLFQRRRVMAVYGTTVMEVMVTLTNTVYETASKTSYMTELTQQLMTCNGAEDLLKLGAQKIQNPLILTDANQKIMLGTPEEQVADPSYRRVLRSEFLPVGHPHHASKTEDHDYAEPEVYSAGTLDEKIPAVVCCVLQHRGKKLGYLHAMGYNHDFTSEDRHLIQLLANFLTMEIVQHPRANRFVRTENVIPFLRSILDCTAGTPEEILERMQEQKIRLYQFLYVMSIVPRSMEFSAHISFYDISTQCPVLFPGSVCFPYQNSILVLLNEKKEITDFEVYLQRLTPMLHKFQMVVGISNPFSAVYQLRQYAFQARKAIDLGTLMTPDKHVYLYSEYLMTYVAETCLKTNNIEMLCPPELIRLIMYCRENGDELLETLKVFLHSGRSKTETAKKMYVHVNTIKYRISQIQNITGVDFGNDDTALNFIFAIKLFEYNGCLLSHKSIDPPQ